MKYNGAYERCERGNEEESRSWVNEDKRNKKKKKERRRRISKANKERKKQVR